MKLFGSLTLMLFLHHFAYSQCNSGEVEVFINVTTDNYGYETLWQLQPNGVDCGNDNIFEGGNTTQIGCDGAGDQNATPGNGYGNNLTVNEGPWCLTEGESYDIIYIEDFGDGGATFEVLVNGYSTASFDGVGLGAVFTFEASEPPAYDLSIFDINLDAYMSSGIYELEAHVFNGGTATVESYDLNYQINGGDIITHEVSGTELVNFATEHVEHDVNIDFSSLGVFDVSIWADNINGGNIDGNPGDDIFFQQVQIGEGTPNIIDTYIDSNYAFETIAGSDDQISRPTDLDFHPLLDNNELWVINKGTENSGGSTVTIFNAGEPDQESLYKQDGNAWHFMSLPTGCAFSQNGNWASSPGVYDANHDGGEAFTGPTLWSSHMDIYAEESGGNGSHLDMCHYSPYCQGIAAEEDNAFWVFDGYSNDIVMYDFVDDHGPGNDYHGDALVHRYSDDQLIKDPNDQIVSHLVFDEERRWLYSVDHGNNRVIRIDITTGSDEGGEPNYPPNEIYEEYLEITGYVQEDVVTDLDKPAGIDVIDDRMIVSEYETGKILIYDISAVPALLLQTLETGLNSVQGVKVGPDGRIWFVDYNTNSVRRAWNQAVGVSEQAEALNSLVYPNPNSGTFTLSSIDNNAQRYVVRDITGKLILEELLMNKVQVEIDLNVQKGIYFIEVLSPLGRVLQKNKVIIQ